MIDTITRTIKEYASDDCTRHMCQSYVNYFDATVKPVYKKFIIEYCDDEQKFNRLGLREEFGGLEIDDVYHSLEFNETEPKGTEYTFEGIVMERYLHMLFNPKILDVKLFEQIWQGDEMIEERWIEFPVTFVHELTRIISKDVLESREIQKARADVLESEIELYQEFIEKYNATEAFRDFREEKAG